VTEITFPGRHVWLFRVGRFLLRHRLSQLGSNGRNVQRTIVAVSGAILSLAVPLTAWAAVDESSTTCFGQAATVVGTEGDDVLTGTDGADVISGLGGTDVIDGLGGADLLCGGDNPLVIRSPQQEFDPEWQVSEVLRGGDGNDRIDGGRGFDSILGGSGDDWISVGPSQPWPRLRTRRISWHPAGTVRTSCALTAAAPPCTARTAMTVCWAGGSLTVWSAVSATTC